VEPRRRTFPLALAVPDLSVELLEPKERKADWLYQAIRKLDLSPRVTVRQARFEDYRQGEVESFDLITARALASPAQVLRMILPAMRGDSQLLLWHSSKQSEEIAEALTLTPGNRQYASVCTLSYVFTSIEFSSNVIGVCEAR